jgi:hypothetical protein
MNSHFRLKYNQAQIVNLKAICNRIIQFRNVETIKIENYSWGAFDLEYQGERRSNSIFVLLYVPQSIS